MSASATQGGHNKPTPVGQKTAGHRRTHHRTLESTPYTLKCLIVFIKSNIPCKFNVFAQCCLCKRGYTGYKKCSPSKARL